MQQRLFLAKGLTESERNAILKEIQLITNNKLKIIKTCALKDCYEIVYDKKENNNLKTIGPGLAKSDRLILELIATDKEVWLTNERDPEGKFKNSDLVNQEYYKWGIINPDKAYVMVSFTNDSLNRKISTLVDGKRESVNRPLYVGLSHELIHAYHDLLSPTKDQWIETEYKAVDHNGNIKIYTENKEEIRTVGIPVLNSNQNLNERYKNGAILFFKPGDITENDIRREHNLPYRNNY